MPRLRLVVYNLIALTVLLVVVAAPASLTPTAPEGRPLAQIDLMTQAGAVLVQGQWRYQDASIVETSFFAAGEDGQPSVRPNKTFDIAPHAGAADFDDSAWQKISPASLPERRGNGRLSFNWYRINITVPESVGGVPTRNTDIVFETSVDDYAEVWVNGELPRAQGQTGGSVVRGWNAPNRLTIAYNAQPGQKISLAVFGANGPLSNPPTNYIFLRRARLDFYPGTATPFAISPREVNVEVDRRDPAIDAIVPRNAKLYQLAEGFQFTEGPVWVRDGNYLLFSDPNANTIYKYTNAGDLSVFRHPSGYSGANIAEYKQPGSNGLTLDRQGRLTANEHGNRRVTRTEKDGGLTVLADRFEGKHLNSPNDLVYRSDGALFFTDPPFGLPKFYDDPRKETPYSGVYSLREGKLRLVSTDLKGPNGIAFSPDEKYLYIGNWEDNRKIVMRYRVQPGATLTEGKVFFDMTATPGEDALDGIKADVAGNLYVSGPGGLWILNAEGKHLGTIRTPRHAHNFAWGDEDGKTLYLCARSGLYKMPLQIAGVRP
jgi:gluconolactonase